MKKGFEFMLSKKIINLAAFVMSLMGLTVKKIFRALLARVHPDESVVIAKHARKFTRQSTS
jgi:antitoxin component of RelBE/YafQ-DinJ toxin-antitoxin module